MSVCSRWETATRLFGRLLAGALAVRKFSETHEVQILWRVCLSQSCVSVSASLSLPVSLPSFHLALLPVRLSLTPILPPRINITLPPRPRSAVPRLSACLLAIDSHSSFLPSQPSRLSFFIPLFLLPQTIFQMKYSRPNLQFYRFQVCWNKFNPMESFQLCKIPGILQIQSINKIYNNHDVHPHFRRSTTTTNNNKSLSLSHFLSV